MAGHIHTDALHIVVLGTGIAVYYHLMRVLAAQIGTKFSPNLGASIGGFFSFSQ